MFCLFLLQDEDHLNSKNTQLSEAEEKEQNMAGTCTDDDSVDVSGQLQSTLGPVRAEDVPACTTIISTSPVREGSAHIYYIHEKNRV